MNGKLMRLAVRWGSSLVLAVGVAAPPRVGMAARAAAFPVAGPTSRSDVELEVKVAPAIVEAAELRKWVEAEGRQVLDGLPKEPQRSGTLRVEIGGELYEYRVVITAVRDGAVVGEPGEWACDCSNEELLKRLRGELAAGAEHLSRQAEESPRPDSIRKPPIEHRQSSPEVDANSRRISGGEVIGLSLVTLGLGGVATGLVFVAKDPSLRIDPQRYETGSETDYRLPGLTMLVAGAGVATTGLVLYLLRRARRLERSSVAIAPTGLGTGQPIGIAIAGRFGR